MSSLPINISDSLNNWADSVSKIKELRLSLSDNLNNWQDSGGLKVGVRVTQLPVEVMIQPVGKVRVTQFPVELMIPTNGLMQLKLSDTLTFSDSVTKQLQKQLQLSGALTMADSVSAVPSAPLLLTLSDSLNNWLDLVSERLFTQLQLFVSDSWNTWLDSVSTLTAVPMRRITQLPVEVMIQPSSQVRVTQIPVELMIPTNGLMQLQLSDNLNNWLSAVSVSVVRTNAFSDSMTLLDSERIVLGDNRSLSDSLVLSDSVQIQLNAFLELDLTVSDNLNNWLDSVTTNTVVLVGLNISVSDTLNFWLDEMNFTETTAPRTAPTGDPSANCCPPSIWITD